MTHTAHADRLMASCNSFLIRTPLTLSFDLSLRSYPRSGDPSQLGHGSRSGSLGGVFRGVDVDGYDDDDDGDDDDDDDVCIVVLRPSFQVFECSLRCRMFVKATTTTTITTTTTTTTTIIIIIIIIIITFIITLIITTSQGYMTSQINMLMLPVKKISLNYKNTNYNV